jgi:hypothetical protein
MGGDFASNPLDRNLGFYDFGRCTTAPGDANHAFEKTHNLWDQELSECDENSNNDSSKPDDSTAQENETTTDKRRKPAQITKELKTLQSEPQKTPTPMEPFNDMSTKRERRKSRTMRKTH